MHVVTCDNRLYARRICRDKQLLAKHTFHCRFGGRRFAASGFSRRRGENMDYIRYTIETREEAEEIVSCLLAEEGIDSLEIDDLLPVDDSIQGGNFEELQPDLPEDDGSCRIRFYLDAEGDHTELLRRVRSALEGARAYADMGSLTIREEQIRREDWQDKWKEYFHSFSIEDILFVPSWENPPADLEGRTLIRIDPGIAFGTGRHESTELCIRAMRHYLKKGDAILDVGFGSGILSVVAASLGAGSLAGTDIDPICKDAVAQNMEANGFCFDPARFYIGNLAEDTELRKELGEGCYDLVFANILADIITAMGPDLRDRLRPGGLLITSGIIDFKQEEVEDALRDQKLEIVEVNALGEWRSIIARRPE